MGQKKRFTPICASSGTIHDMLNAFENKLNEVGASTSVTASEATFRDPNSVLGLGPDETITISELEDMYDEYHDDDPVMQKYTSFQEWWIDTKPWLEEVDDVEGCDAVQAATIQDMLGAFQDKLQELGASTKIEGANCFDSDVDDKIFEISERYASSQPLSGDWDSEAAHELAAIMKETGLDEECAKAKMIELLGFDADEVMSLTPLEASTSVEAADAIDNLSEDYIKSLVEKIKGDGTEYQMDNKGDNILLTQTVDDVVVEYTVPLADLTGDIEKDTQYIQKAMNS